MNQRPRPRPKRPAPANPRMSKPAVNRMAAVGHPRQRARLVLMVFALVMAIFAAQLFRLQWFNADETQKQALAQRVTRTNIPAARGEIVDSKGTVLARSLERRDVTGDPVAASEYMVDGKKLGIPGASKKIASILGGDPDQIEKKFRDAEAKKSRFLYVAKDISPAQWGQLAAAGIPGIFSEMVQKREYPEGTAMASLIGWVNNAGEPGGGIEQMMDADLRGKDGIHQIERAQNGAQIATGDNLDIKPVDGRNVELTIDSDLQWYAQNELAAAVKKTQAASGEVVVSDTHGNILTAASYPSFDNNDMQTAQSDALQNHAFNDTFEPGSTQKMVTVGALVNEGLVNPLSHITVPPTLERAGREFHDAEEHGTEDLTLAGVVAKSSNIGTILAGEKMPKETLYSYMKKLGLGENPGIGFPGESSGILRNVNGWKGDTWYTVMFGQGMATSPLQQIGIFQTMANGGVRDPLKLIKGVQNNDGTLTSPKDDRKSERVFTAKTSRELIEMMRGVVSKEGSAAKAAVPGYDVAGKTSTAQQFNPKTRNYDGVTAGFIGMAPANNPKYIISVNIQKPKIGQFGGDLAAPVFSKIMSYALSKGEVPPSKETKLPYPIEFTTEEKK